MAEVFASGAYEPRDAAPGRLAFARTLEGRGVVVTVSTMGEPLDGPGDVWPPAALGPQPVRIARMDADGR